MKKRPQHSHAEHKPSVDGPDHYREERQRHISRPELEGPGSELSPLSGTAKYRSAEGRIRHSSGSAGDRFSKEPPRPQVYSGQGSNVIRAAKERSGRKLDRDQN